MSDGHVTARPRARLAALATILVVAALLRFTGLRFGEGVPAARPDESTAMGALSVMPTARLPPNIFFYGGGYLYPLYGFMRVSAALRGEGDIGEEIAREPFGTQVEARAWSAFLSTLTVALVYVVGRHVVGVPGGLLAAAILASCALAVREAHFAKPDSAAAFAAALLLLTFVRRWRTPGRWAGAIGAAAGLAASTKACVGFLPAALLALWLAPERDAQPSAGAAPDRRRSLVAGIAALATVFLALNVFCVLQPVAFWMILRGMPQVLKAASWTGADMVGGPLRYHSLVSLRYGCGAAFACLVAPALAYGLWRGGTLRLIAVAVLGYAATLLTGDVAVARYVLPALPGLAVLVSAFVMAAIERVPGPGLARTAAMLAVAAAITVEPLANAATLVGLLRRTDTRALAAEWIDAHVPAGDALASFGARSVWTDYGRPPTGARPTFPRLPPAQWRSRGVRWVVSAFYPMPYADQPLAPGTPGLERVALFDPFDGPLDDPILEPMDAFFLPLAHFAGITRPGPRIEIYALRP